MHGGLPPRAAWTGATPPPRSTKLRFEMLVYTWYQLCNNTTIQCKLGSFLTAMNTITKTYTVTISNRDILRMALPISLAILVPQINFITNNIFLGHLDRTGDALSTAGITGVYYLLFAVVGQGLNNGLQALIARRPGEGRIGEIGKLFSQGMIVSLGLAFAGIAVTWFLAPVALGWSLHSAALRDQAIAFLRIRIWGLPFLYVYQMRNALLVGTNQSKYLVYGTLAETAVNIVLDYALIFGHLGLPALGFNG